MRFFVFLIMLAIALTMSLAMSAIESDMNNNVSNTEVEQDDGEELVPVSLQGITRRLLLSHHGQHHHRPKMSCNKYPRICHLPGSPGRDCCKKKCVNVLTDERNCGLCGHKCKYSEICCKGKCVNPRWDKKHCGGCDVKCKKGHKCQYGMCSYA